MQNQTVTYQSEPVIPCKTFRRNGRTRLQGFIIKRGDYKGCKIIDDNLRFRGNHYVVVELKRTTAKITFKKALELVK